jgi:NADH dehydrogenase
VRADLRLGERAFVAGDAARVVDTDGEPAPASAQTAVRQADVAAKNVGKLLNHERNGEGFEPRLDRYRYTELGWLVSVGDGAVAQVGGQVVRGRAAKALKTTVGAGYLTSIGAVKNASDYVWEKVGGAKAD